MFDDMRVVGETLPNEAEVSGPPKVLALASLFLQVSPVAGWATVYANPPLSCTRAALMDEAHR